MTKIQIKKSTVAGVVPTTGNLDTAELGINTADKKMYSSNGTAIFEVGSNLTSLSVNNAIVVGNSTVNVVANSISLKLSNSTVNTIFTLPNTAQYSATNAFLHANGQWVNVAAGGGGGSPGGANTQIQFNDSGAFLGSAGLTFDKTSNNMTLGNTFFTDVFSCNVGQGNYIVAGANVTLDGTTVGAVSIGTGLTTLIIPTYMQMPTQNVLSVTTADANTARLAIYNGAMTRLAIIDAWGEEDFMQSSFGQKAIAMSHAVAAGTTPSVFGAAIANTLAYTARTPASTNYYTASKRVGIASNTTAGTSAEHRASSLFLTRGNSSNSGGFLFEIKFGISVISTNYRFFCGLKNTTSVLANGNPSAQTNILGVGIDSTQSNLHIMHNDASSPATTIDLGSNFPTNAGNTYIYMARFWCPPNANFINYNIRRLDVDFSAQGSLTTNIPGVTEFLAPRVWVNNGSDAAIASIDFMSWYTESTL